MFIVIEGLDGSGKSTQAKKVEKYFQDKGIKTKFIHFPQVESPVYGELIAKFLRGELGTIEQVNPTLLALLYAGDRSNAKATLEGWLKEGYVVIADRYVYSNIAYQAAKLGTIHEQDRLARWILSTEYEYFKIPKPDLNLFIDVPADFTKQQLEQQRTGDDRNYLNGSQDIHEADLNFQQQVRFMYMNQVAIREDFDMVRCEDENGKMLSEEEVFNKILPYLDKIQ